jgi:hypothetical protein
MDSQEAQGAVDADQITVRFGRPEEWKRFAQDRSELLSRLPRVYNLANAVFNRSWATDKPVDRLVFSLGILCFEDFEEILLLGANGHGFGCQKILRGMFERVVTASHLHRVPTDAQRFLDFHPISDYKLVREVFDSVGQFDGITADVVAEKKRLRDAALPAFETRCRTSGCDRMVNGFSWSPLDVVSMARVDDGLKELIGIAYYVPMAFTHATVQAVLSHMAMDGQGVTLADRDNNARTWADRVVCAAHNLTLRNFALQVKHFPDLGSLQADLDACAEDFQAAWKSN